MGILVPATISVNVQNLFPLPQESKQNICHQLEVITLQNIPVLTNILALTATIFLEGLVHLYTWQKLLKALFALRDKRP